MIEYNINNGGVLKLHQLEKDGLLRIMRTDENDNTEYTFGIPAGDVVMLINLYRYIKSNDIQNDFINPTGKNKY